eukprot:6652418-Prymnesium_polylepis.1
MLPPPRSVGGSRGCSSPPAAPRAPAATAGGGGEGVDKPSMEPSTPPTAAEKTSGHAHRGLQAHGRAHSLARRPQHRPWRSWRLWPWRAHRRSRRVQTPFWRRRGRSR